jgi:hypothetical protein
VNGRCIIVVIAEACAARRVGREGMASHAFAAVAVQLGPFNSFTYQARRNMKLKNLGGQKKMEHTVVEVAEPFPRELPDEERDNTNDGYTAGNRHTDNRSSAET